MATVELNEIEEETSVLWNCLLKQAQANWVQARANEEGSRANLAQARANEETSRAMHLLTQRMPSQGAIEMVPDRFESWYAAECDAEAGVSIADKIVKQAEGVLDPGTGEEQRGSRGKGEASPATGLQLLHKDRRGNQETSALCFRIARGWWK